VIEAVFTIWKGRFSWCWLHKYWPFHKHKGTKYLHTPAKVCHFF